jgi:hypothetical protein
MGIRYDNIRAPVAWVVFFRPIQMNIRHDKNRHPFATSGVVGLYPTKIRHGKNRQGILRGGVVGSSLAITQFENPLHPHHYYVDIGNHSG